MDNKICFAIVLKKKQQKKRRFFIFIYLAWMNFPLGPFSKTDNLSKMDNLDNSCKDPRKIDKYFSFAKSNLRENFYMHLRDFLTFLLLVFIEK